MSDSPSRNHLIELLADAAGHELEFFRYAQALESATAQWEIARDLFADSVKSSADQSAKSHAERSFVDSCFVFAELLEKIGPRYEQSFDLMSTHYELAVREQKQIDPARVDEIAQMASGFHELRSHLADATERATRCANTAGTLAVSAALYPPNPDLETGLVRVERLQREMVGIYRSVGERYRKMRESIDV